MSKKNGAARAEQPAHAAPRRPQLAEKPARDKFNLWTTEEFGQFIREYCGEHRITFNALAHAALRDFFKRHRTWPGESDLMPRGTRLRIRRAPK